MSMKVEEQSGVVTISCGGETVVVVGSVVRPQPTVVTPTPKPVLIARPGLPPAHPPGVSVTVAAPRYGEIVLDEAINPSLDDLLAGVEFKNFARRVRGPWVVTVSPSSLRTFRAAKKAGSVAVDVGEMPIVHKYLSLK